MSARLRCLTSSRGTTPATPRSHTTDREAPSVKTYEPLTLGLTAEAPKSTAPGMEIIHESDDARLVVFRLEPGQKLTEHTSPSTVVLTVLQGTGIIDSAAGERSMSAGELVVFEPRELHGLHATEERFVVLATLAPRPATR